MTDTPASASGPGQPPVEELVEAFHRSGDAAALVDDAGRHHYVNPAYAELFHLDPRRGEETAWVTLFAPDQPPDLEELGDDLPVGGTWRGELLATAGEEEPVAVDTVLTRLAGGRFLCVARPLAEKGEITKRLEHLAFYDPLTDLPNRRLLQEKARQAMAFARRSGGAMALLYLDLDGFKEVNDSLGHAVGDRVLEKIARRVDEPVRETDVAARVGGDEFAVLLADVEGEAAAIEVARRVLRSLRRPLAVEDHELRLDASIGLAFYPRYASSYSELLRQADLAMYGAGREKAVGIRVYRPEFGVAAPRQAALLDDLHRALRSYRLTLHYQPVRVVETGRVVGAQALLRWPHPELGVLAAAKFLPLVEEAGLLRKVDRWVLARAAFQLSSWTEEGYEGWLAVHLSESSLAERDLPDYVATVMDTPPLTADGRLILQFPARKAAHDPVEFGRLCRRLRAEGVGISVDALGPETDSTDFLQEERPDIVQVDRSLLVANGRPERARLLQTVIERAHERDVRVVAKGVERRAEATRLREMECDFAQGYLLGWAVPPDRFLREARARPGSGESEDRGTRVDPVGSDRVRPRKEEIDE